MCQKYTEEVNMIRKILSILFLSALMLGALSLAPRAEAATLSSKTGAVTTSSGSLNVRSQASSSASVVATLKKGSYITLISKSGSWWQVEYAKGQYGYCHADYITIVQGTPVTVNTQSSGLNVRSGPGTSYGKVATLYKGEVLGLFGLMGSGRTEMARMLFGIDTFESGRVTIEGKELERASTRESIRNKMAFVTENRREEGLLMNINIADNITSFFIAAP